MTQVDDRTLIYMLFDAVTKLSERLLPGEELRLAQIAAAPQESDGRPLGMYDVYWTRRQPD
jgi:hypothetical protein